METTFDVGSVRITIEHQSCTDWKGLVDDPAEVIVDESGDPDTLTRIASGSDQLFVYWEPVQSLGPNVAIAPETSVLFFGAGIFVLSASLPQLSVIERHDVVLFWSFERHGDWIIAYGELECNLYSLDGHRRATVAVDPPYDIERTDSGVRFSSDVAGVQWLKFPDSPAL